MAYSKTEKTVWELAEPIVRQEGCYLYDVEYVKEGGVWFLRIFADRDGGISLDTCEAVSRRLSQELDRADPIPQNYYLEVSSPGVERKLKRPEHFARYLGAAVDVNLYRPLRGSRQLTGTLRGYDGETLRLGIGQETVEIPMSAVSLVHLHFDF